MADLETAIALAAQTHRGRRDKRGQPLILHVLRVLMRVAEPRARIVAALHDVVEDGPTTLDDIRAAGFDDEIVAAVDAISKRKGESYEDFVTRTLHDALARKVKLADLADNIESVRLGFKSDPARLQRYERARARVLAAEAGATGDAPDA